MLMKYTLRSLDSQPLRFLHSHPSEVHMNTRIRCCLIIATLALASANGLQAQATGRGSILIGGSGSFTSSGSGDSVRTTVIDFQPSVQYFIQRGLAVGGELTLGRTA